MVIFLFINDLLTINLSIVICAATLDASVNTAPGVIPLIINNKKMYLHHSVFIINFHLIGTFNLLDLAGKVVLVGVVHLICGPVLPSSINQSLLTGRGWVTGLNNGSCVFMVRAMYEEAKLVNAGVDGGHTGVLREDCVLPCDLKIKHLIKSHQYCAYSWCIITYVAAT